MTGLKEKLKKIRLETKAVHVDWLKRRDLWVSQVDGLYGKIRNWFADLIAEGYMSLSLRSKTLVEDFIGRYQVPVLEIDLHVCPQIVLEPIGTNVRRSMGRIDIYIKGHESETRMILLREGEDGAIHWELWRSKERAEMEYLNKETFEKLMEEWIDAWS